MAGDGANQGGFDYTLDANLIDDSSWIAPPQAEQYSQSQQPHHDQFMPQQQNYQQYAAPSDYTTSNNYSTPYGAQQQSPYTFQSQYVNHFQPQNDAGNFPTSQYGLSYSPAATFSQSQQAPALSPFSYSDHGMGAPTVSPQALQMNGAQTYTGNGALSELQGGSDANQQFGSYGAAGGFGGNLFQLSNGLYNHQSHIPQENANRPYSSVTLPTAASTSQSSGIPASAASYASQYSRSVPQTTTSGIQSSTAAVPAASYISQYSRSVPRATASASLSPSVTVPTTTTYNSQYLRAAPQATKSTSQPSSAVAPTTSPYVSQYSKVTPQSSQNPISTSPISSAPVSTASYAGHYSSTSLQNTSSTSPDSSANPSNVTSVNKSSDHGLYGPLSLDGAQMGPRNELGNIAPAFKFTPPGTGRPFITLPNAPFLVQYSEPVMLDIGPQPKTKKAKSVKTKRAKDSLPGTSAPRIRAPKTTTSTSKLKNSELPKVKDVKSRSSAAIGPKSTSSPSPSLMSSSEEESSSDEYESEDDMETTARLLKDLRGETRPVEPVTAAGWDAVGIVFVPKYLVASREQIITATPEYEKLIGGLREELKSINTDLAKAESENRIEDVQKLKDNRSSKRMALQSATSRAVETGHPDILRNLGNSQKLVNSLVSILIDCIKMEDYVGELPRSVLRLLAHFTTLNGELLKRVKFDAVEKRFGKKGDPELKGYISTIRANTSEAEEKAKRIKEDAERPLATATASDSSKILKQQEKSKLASTSPLKRPHEADAANDLPNKKTTLGTTTLSSAPKPLAATTRQTNFFATLNRAGMKPAAKPINAATASTVKKPETRVEATPAPPQSSLIAGLIASIEKPRELPKPVEAPRGPPETAEEKAKRERKESRRHLRVRWKDGSALVEIKLFKHDKAEDEGRQDNMLRDAHDDRSEGMMLKQRIQEAVGDEDDDGGEIEYQPYPDLLPIDFSEMNYRDKDHWGHDYQQAALATRGDILSFTTPQQKVQQKREATELMVIYTDPNDIPPTAKEPASSAGDQLQDERAFAQPTETWVVQRLQAIRQHELNPTMPNFSTQYALTPDITSILKAMQGSAPHQPGFNAFGSQQLSSNLQHPSAASSQRYAFDQPTRPQALKMDSKKAEEECAKIFNTLEQMGVLGKKFPADVPPEWMNEKQRQEWWEGFYRDKSNSAVQQKSRDDATKILKIVGMAPTQQPQLLSYEPPPPITSGISPPNYDQGHHIMSNQTQGQISLDDLSNLSQSQLQELLAGFGKQGNQATQIQPPNGYDSFSLAQNQNTAAGIGVSQAELQSLLVGLGAQNSQEYNPQPSVQGHLPGLDPQTQAQLQNYIAGLNNPNTQVQSQQQADYYAAWANAQDGQNYNHAYGIQSQSYDALDHGKQNQAPRWDSSSNNSSWKESQRPGNKINQDNQKRSWGGDYDEQDLDSRFPPGEARRGKKPCKFWGDGKCAKGIKCGYLHDGRGG